VQSQPAACVTQGQLLGHAARCLDSCSSALQGLQFVLTADTVRTCTITTVTNLPQCTDNIDSSGTNAPDIKISGCSISPAVQLKFRQLAHAFAW